MAFKELLTAKQNIEQIVNLLQEGGNQVWADRLHVHLQNMQGWFATKENLYAVGTLCHPKALGDVLVPGVTGEEWSVMIGQLEESCAIAFNLLERLPPEEQSAV